MGSLINKLKQIIDIDDDFDDAFDELDEEKDWAEPKKGAVSAAAARPTASPARPAAAAAQPQPEGQAQKPKLQVHTTKAPELAVEIHVPTGFDNAERIADDLLAKKAVVVNFERVDAKLMVRISDFINGVAYVLDCEARPISGAMILYVPSGVSVSTVKAKPIKK